MRFPLPRTAILIACACLAQLAWGQTPRADEDWKRLSLAGKVTVHLKSGDRLRGTMRDWQPNGFRIEDRGGRTVEAARDEVARVTRKSRGRGALIGLIVGFAAGFPFGAAAGPYIADFGNPPVGTRLRHGAGWGMFSGGVGAGIGALAGKQVTVYRARVN